MADVGQLLHGGSSMFERRVCSLAWECRLGVSRKRASSYAISAWTRPFRSGLVGRLGAARGAPPYATVRPPLTDTVWPVT
jgi:hypothetical protein